MIACKLNGCFDSFCPGVSEINPTLDATRREPCKFLGKSHHVLVIEVCSRHVQEVSRLALDGFDDAWVAMASGDYCNACVEVEETVSINIFDNCSLASLDDEGVAPRIGGGKDLIVSVDNRLSARPGQSRHQMR